MNAASGLLGSATRTLRWQVSTPCQYCAKRMASKARFKRKPLTEVELTTSVDNLGQAGQRVRVAPGMMRNHLYPKRMALYVLDGRTLALDGTLRSKKSAATADVGPSSSNLLLESAQASSRKQVDEGKLVEQLSRLEPLQFVRKTTGQDTLHGSVTTQDVLEALQARGIEVSALEGEFQSQAGQDGIENGRIKKTGQYLFNAKFQHRQQAVIVHVVKE